MKNYIILLLGILSLASCEKVLNIEPEQSLLIEASFSDENTTRATLIGAYSRCQDLDVFGATPQIINDYMADNVRFIGSFPTLQDINNYNTISDNTTVANIFRDHYRAVLAANAVIKYTPDVDDVSFTTEEKANVVAEAKFLRALVNFNLVNLFGQPYTLDNGASPGIAIELTPDILEEAFVAKPRSTVAETYNQIEKDLIEALDALADSGDKTKASMGAASALLSRLYLYKADYPAAANAASDVLNNAKYEMASDYSFYNGTVPGGGTTEDVFVIYMSAIDNSRTGSGGWASFYNPSERGARGDCPFAQSLLNAFAAEPGDLRMEMSQVGANGLTYTTKFPDATNNSDNAPVIRVSEMALTRAEALARISPGSIDVEALGLYNQIRTRAGLPVKVVADFGTTDAFVEAILLERRKEFCFEGHRRMDMLRVGQELRTGDSDTAPGANKVVMPIPQREIDLGSSTPQNSGY